MKQEDLGFDGWFRERYDTLNRDGFHPVRVTAVSRDRYLVRNEEGETPAELTGRLLFSAESGEHLPCVGDWVLVAYHNAGTLAIIHELIPRKTILRRKTPGRRVDYQPIASNIDVALIIQSCDRDFNLRRMERYLVAAREGRIEPIILLSKTDLVTPDELDQLISGIRQAHITSEVVPFSNLTMSGQEEIHRLLEKGKTYCLLGSSGVGKTTLLNRLIGREEFETSPVREKDSRGRHTTARRQLVVLDDGAMLIDTPGMRELGMIGTGDAIKESFSDITELSGNCHFSDCTHTRETGCAILSALEEGSLSEERYRSYLKLKRESVFYGMSYAEKRRRDRKFGKMAKSIMKEKKRKRGEDV